MPSDHVPGPQAVLVLQQQIHKAPGRLDDDLQEHCKILLDTSKKNFLQLTLLWTKCQYFQNYPPSSNFFLMLGS